MSEERLEAAVLPEPSPPLGGSALRRRGRLRWLARAVSIVGVLSVAALVAHEVLAGGGELTSAARRLSQPAIALVAVAIACEALSYLFYARGQSRLLGGARRQIRVRWLASLAVCAQAVSNFVPAGYIAANVLNFRALRRRGLAAQQSAWLLVMSSSLYIGALAVLTVASGSLAGAHATGGLDAVRYGAFAVLASLALVGLSARLLAKRGALRLPHSWRGRIPPARLDVATLAGAAGLFAASWLADCGCFVLSIRAVGGAPDWSLVPIAYCAAQLVSFLPITPGGLGLVEGSLTITLVAGGPGGNVLAAVLLYRIISYWATLPCGLLGYLAVRSGCAAESISLDGDGKRPPTLSDRAAGENRSLVLLEG